MAMCVATRKAGSFALVNQDTSWTLTDTRVRVRTLEYSIKFN